MVRFLVPKSLGLRHDRSYLVALLKQERAGARGVVSSERKAETKVAAEGIDTAIRQLDRSIRDMTIARFHQDRPMTIKRKT